MSTPPDAALNGSEWRRIPPSFCSVSFFLLASIESQYWIFYYYFIIILSFYFILYFSVLIFCFAILFLFSRSPTYNKIASYSFCLTF